jgi:hypothetical protein
MRIEEIIDTALAMERTEDTAKRGPQNAFYVSSISGCLRGAFLSRSGLVSPELEPFKYRIFKCGNLVEDFVGNCYRKMGMIVSEQESMQWPEYDLRGRLDFLVNFKDSDETRVVECKSVNSNKFFWDRKRGGRPSDAHIHQVAWYWDKKIAEIPGLTASVLQLDKDSLQTNEYIVPREELEAYTAIGKSRAKLLKECWDTGVLPPVPETVVVEFGKHVVNWVAKYCPHHHVCLGDDFWFEKAEKEAKKLNSRAVI